MVPILQMGPLLADIWLVSLKYRKNKILIVLRVVPSRFLLPYHLHCGNVMEMIT